MPKIIVQRTRRTAKEKQQIVDLIDRVPHGKKIETLRALGITYSSLQSYRGQVSPSRNAAKTLANENKILRGLVSLYMQQAT